MQITYSRDEYYENIHDIMLLTKYLGDFKVTEGEKGRLTVRFPNNAQGIAEFYLQNRGTDFGQEVADWYLENKIQDNLLEQLIQPEPKTEPDTNAAILEELKKLNETISGLY